jgi:hypothetical protein
MDGSLEFVVFNSKSSVQARIACLDNILAKVHVLSFANIQKSIERSLNKADVCHLGLCLNRAGKGAIYSSNGALYRKRDAGNRTTEKECREQRIKQLLAKL